MANNNIIGIRNYHRSQDNKRETYDVLYAGRTIYTTVTNDHDVVTEWLILSEPINQGGVDRLRVGLDIKYSTTSSSDHQHNNKRPRAATLNLCIGNRCLIYQIMHNNMIPQALTDLFKNHGSYTFLGVGIKDKLEKLVSEYHEIGQTPRLSMDLGKMAAESYLNRPELRSAGIKDLARVLLGRIIERPLHVEMSRWDERWLNAEQVMYASVDAFTSFEIGTFLYARRYPAYY